jgi:hypothetical protein
MFFSKARFNPCLAITALLLAACTTSSSDNQISDSQAVPVPDEPQADQPVADEPQADSLPPPSGPLKAADIMQALSEKTFNYTKGSKAGTVTYFKDGTFSYTETGKGAGTGIWQASDGKLCASYNATSFLPKGTRSECHPFTSTGGNYTAGQMQLKPA